jgi:hypothetical protein
MGSVLHWTPLDAKVLPLGPHLDGGGGAGRKA